MKPLFTILLFFLFALHGSAQSKKPGASSSEVLTNATIINLHKAGFDDDIIVAKINTSQTNVDLSTDKLIALKNAGIDNSVIKALMNQGGNSTVSRLPANENASRQNGLENAISLLNYPYVVGNDNNYKPLEKLAATLHMKLKALALGGTDIVFNIDGDKSPIRLNTEQPVTFWVNTGGSPLPDWVLYKLTVKDHKRGGTVAKVNVMGIIKDGESATPFNANVIKPGIYQLTLSNKLSPGEYYFAPKQINDKKVKKIDVFAFGID